MRVFIPNTIEQFAWASVWTFHPTINNYLNRDLMRRIAFLLGDSHDILPCGKFRLCGILHLKNCTFTFFWLWVVSAM